MSRGRDAGTSGGGRIALGRSCRVVPVGFALLAVALVLVGCAGSPPVRAVRAARYYAAGTQALERGETRDAIDALEHAVGLMPNASEIHNHLGLAYWSDGREVAALRELERAVELDCENDAARGNLARLRARMAFAADGAAAGGGASDGSATGGAADGDPASGDVVGAERGGESGAGATGIDSSGAAVRPAGVGRSAVHGG